LIIVSGGRSKLKILFLAPNQLWKYNNGHQRFRNAIGEAHETIYFGEGFDGWPKTGPVDADKLVRMNNPDVVMTYSLKYTTRFKKLPKISNVLRVHFVDDFVGKLGAYTGYEVPYTEFLKKNNFDICFCRTQRVVDIMKKRKLCKAAFFLPFSVDVSFFRELDINRDIDVCSPMSLVSNVYPNRDLAHNMVRASGCTYFVDRVFKKPYLRILNRSKILVNSVNHWRAFNFKILEAISCGTLVLTDKPEDLDDVGLIDGEHLILYNKIADIPGLIRYWASHDNERTEITNNALYHVLMNHSNEARVEEMTSILEGYL
jgi:spore maturation protein CgeB